MGWIEIPVNTQPILSNQVPAINLASSGNGGVTGSLPVTGIPSIGGRYTSSTSVITSSLGQVNFTNATFDTNSAYANGIYTVAVPGKYQVNLSLAISGTIALNNSIDVQIRQAGSIGQNSEEKVFAGGALTAFNANMSDIFNCAVNDTIKVFASSDATLPVLVASSSQNYLSIYRL